MSDDDWRQNGQDRYLRGAGFRWRAYRAPSPSWDHDHCEFCSLKLAELGPDVLTHGWQTEDEYRWVCGDCFEEFRTRFGFVVLAEGSAPRGVELHDARILDVQSAHGQIALSLDAFVHDDVVGTSGAGAWQRIDVLLSEAKVESDRRGDGVVLDGKMRVGPDLYENVMPLPASWRRRDLDRSRWCGPNAPGGRPARLGCNRRSAPGPRGLE
jgi:hypothetical protein